MKYIDTTEIQAARQTEVNKAMPTDILVIPKVVKSNASRLAQNPPRRKRRTNYVKKIMNDPFIFNV